MREVALMEQHMEGAGTVREFLGEKSQTLGVPVKLTNFVRWKAGEGLQKADVDFAEQVRQELQKFK